MNPKGFVPYQRRSVLAALIPQSVKDRIVEKCDEVIEDTSNGILKRAIARGIRHEIKNKGLSPWLDPRKW